MKLFFELEIAYIIIAIFFLVVTIIATTRSFSPKNSFKKIFPVVFVVLAIAIATHYNITTSRMYEVETAFNSGKYIICENRTKKDIGTTIVLSQNQGWILNDHIFSNKDYFKSFISARCLEYYGVVPKEQKEEN